MNNAEVFFKEFIESKKFKKLQSVNKISDIFGLHIIHGMSIWPMGTIGELPNIIKVMRNQRNTVVVIRTNSTMKNKIFEYFINQDYTIKVDEILNYYDGWRDKKIQDILEYSC